MLTGNSLRVLDVAEFVDVEVLPALRAGDRIPSVVLHRTCSSAQLGLHPALSRVATAVADEVVEPEDRGCCAFAGDRGLLHPELTASATAAESSAVVQADGAAHASVKRTCELAVTRATGRTYRHLLELLDDVTRPDPDRQEPGR
ncbi:hypothetical protein ACIRU8_40130 [Streptomyces sp. NPDC101175]|uniref:hypothetical protein n=1 Tax=Streptomyces sp. NPDC101175 TaxID=3366123 RepID=UPI003837F073